MKALKNLNLSENQLSILPHIDLESVESINFQKNKLSDLSGFSTSVLPKLIKLDLTFNSLKYFPSMKLESLVYLYLSNNEIESIN